MSDGTGDIKDCALPNCAIHDHPGTAGRTRSVWNGVGPPPSVSDTLKKAIEEAEDLLAEAVCCATEAGHKNAEPEITESVVATKAAHAAIRTVARVALEETERDLAAVTISRDNWWADAERFEHEVERLRKAGKDALTMMEAWQTDFEALANDPAYKAGPFSKETLALRAALREGE